MKLLLSVHYKGLPTAKTVSPKSGPATVRQKDLWFESSTTLNGGEDQAFAVDSHLTEGISRSQLDSSLSRRIRGRAAIIHFYSCPNWRLQSGTYILICIHGHLITYSTRNDLHDDMSLCVDVNIYINTVLGTSSQRCTGVDDACYCLPQSSRAASRNVDEQIAAALLRLQRDMATIMHRLDALEALALSQVKDHFWHLKISCNPLKLDLSPPPLFSLSLVKIMFTKTGRLPTPGQKGPHRIML